VNVRAAVLPTSNSHQAPSYPPLAQSWDRNTYRAHAADPSNLETLPITMDQNLFTCNYRAYYPIDNDDGSNAYIQTRNFLLWGGAKSLMGYNKAFLSNTFVYVDFTPVESARRLAAARGFSLGEDTPAMRAKYPAALRPRRGALGVGNGVSTCTSSVAPWPSAQLGLADQFRDNTCIASSSQQFFSWYNVRTEEPQPRRQRRASPARLRPPPPPAPPHHPRCYRHPHSTQPCNSSTPTDGSMWLMSNNIYRSTDASYRNNCDKVTWNLTEAQALGVDVGSVLAALPSTDELVAMGHALLQF
jgi:hypothetical protein